MSKIIDFVNDHMDGFIIASAIVAVAGTAIGAAVYNREKDRKHEASLPDSYWEAKARSSEANAKARIEIAKIQSETELKKSQDEYDAMKVMPDSYFEMKKAEIMRDAAVKSAKIDAEARTASVREQTRALNNTVDALAKSMKENN